MNLAFTREEETFREEVRDFLAEKLTADLRAYAKRMTSVYSTKPIAMEWQRILVAKGWACPSWPVEYGGTNWSVAQRYIFDVEMARAGAPPSRRWASACAARPSSAMARKRRRITTSPHPLRRGFLVPGLFRTPCRIGPRRAHHVRHR